MLHLKNELLRLSVNPTGAELSAITSVNHQTEFMWNGNPDVWNGIAPVLFPIVGGLKNNTFLHHGKTYQLPRHGFVRRNTSVEVHEITQDKLTFKLASGQELLKSYPFQFEFYTSFQLKENTIIVSHNVKNTDHQDMYFSLGAHPAFKCPVYPNETYSDYHLEFEFEEHSKTHLLDPESGLLNNQTELVLNNTSKLPLNYHLFDKDALIFKDLKSKKVTLTSKNKGPLLSVSYQDFPYLGIWAKPNADYVCIEPWLGVADNVNSNQLLKDKEAIIKLAPNKSFEAHYTITVENSLLV
ncbi:aldose 1-epimerase family protein [Mangrovimonas sp. YM274]|uniref:aldose 1-epimerase family protein n=1 Tax=Mangrovimonas sp. YM274 TaxID=3070660 RepID=UPI0027DCED47|nr:aldose 1-epimerase family protein [Mangrovimonas sp. YM274]WMI67552.1 aldose 1-epimerase family protein [Mangrovimonas sp. YM274]